MTVKALEGFDITRKDAERAKNMFALGLLSWLYNRPVEGTLKFLDSKFAAKPEILDANKAAFQAGWNYGETTEAFSVQYEVKPATLTPGTYRNITGNTALAYGLVAASRRSGLPLFLGSYPITPASDILHELSKLKRFGVRTFQAEDEISGVGAALGASFGGGARRDDHVRPRHVPEGGDHRAGRLGRAAARSSATSSGPARPPACRPRPSRPTCSWRCSAGTASRRSPSSRRRRPPTASTPRWRPSGSRSSTARR